MRINARVIGDKEITKKLQELARKSQAGLKKAITESAIHVEGEAKENAPVDTGRLRASITHEVKENTARVGTNVKYACVYNAKTPVYDPIDKTSYGIGHYKSDYVLSKDGKTHKIEKKHKFYQKNLSLVEIICHSRRQPLIVTDNHLILILRDNNLMWAQAKDLIKTDMVFTKRSHNAVTDNSNQKEFICVCGKTFFINNSILKYKSPKYCSLDCRHKYGPHDQNTGMRWKLSKEFCKKYRNGANNPQWKGGISKLPYDWRFNKQLKEKIKQRDNNCCQICKVNNNIIIHHKDSNKMNSDENNLITLCNRCHAYVTHGKLECELPVVNLDIFKPITIKNIKYISKKRCGKLNIGFIYDFSVKNENSFYVGGILVHNSHVEFGTSKQRAQPYLIPALQNSRAKILSFIERAIKAVKP